MDDETDLVLVERRSCLGTFGSVSAQTMSLLCHLLSARLHRDTVTCRTKRWHYWKPRHSLVYEPGLNELARRGMMIGYLQARCSRCKRVIRRSFRVRGWQE